MRTLVALLSAALLAACGAPGRGDAPDGSVASATAAPPLALDAAVPAYDATTLGGERVRIGGEAAPLTLVNVWATWCTSCREEMADLEALHRELAPRGLRVVAVSIDAGSAARVRRFVERQRLTFPVVHDAAGEIQRRYGVVGVPETYLVTPDGRLRWHHVGGIHGATRDARAAIVAALGDARGDARGRAGRREPIAAVVAERSGSSTALP